MAAKTRTTVPAEITGRVRLAVAIPDADEIEAEIGTISLPVTPDGVDCSELNQRIADLLTAAAEHYRASPVSSSQDLPDTP